jgi:serine/threonine protein kinase
MGTVFLAEHEVLKKRYAVKMLRSRFAAQPEVAARFLQEARATNAFSHDHIVKIYDFGQSPDGGAFLVMELLEGEPFDHYLSKRGALPLAEALPLFQQLASALDAAHRAGITHRDLKPENVFVLSREGAPFVKVLDFGIARVVGDLAIPGLTRAGTVVGTPQYMSPEQLTGQPAEARADIYSLGILFFQALAGALPFPGPKLSDFAQQHLYEPVPLLRTRRPDLSEGIEVLVARMMAKAAAERPASMAEVGEALQQIAKGQQPTLSVVRALPPRPELGWRLLLGTAALLAVLCVLVLWKLRGESDPLSQAQAELTQGDAAPLLALARAQSQAALASSSSKEKAQALRDLLDSGEAAPPALFAEALHDPEWEVRLLAAQGLAARKDEESRALLRAAYEADGAQTTLSLPRYSLLMERVRAGDETARPLLAQGLENPKVSPKLKFDAALALVSLGEEAGRPLLLAAILDAERNPENALKAANALFSAPDNAEALALLRSVASGESQHWRLAAQFLAQHGEASARERLVGAARRGDFEAIYALAALRDEEARGPLLARIQGNAAEKARAALALARVGEASDLAVLAPLLQDPDTRIQNAAARAMLAISATHQEAP